MYRLYLVYTENIPEVVADNALGRYQQPPRGFLSIHS